jgi:hypothetical protein
LAGTTDLSDLAQQALAEGCNPLAKIFPERLSAQTLLCVSLDFLGNRSPHRKGPAVPDKNPQQPWLRRALLHLKCLQVVLVQLFLEALDREVEALPRMEDFEKSRASQFSGIVERHHCSTLRLQSVPQSGQEPIQGVGFANQGGRA